MKSITQDNHQMEALTQKMYLFFERYGIGKLLRSANASKLKGSRSCRSSCSPSALVKIKKDLHLDAVAMTKKSSKMQVFFKACKSYLRLARDCRSISYDAMTAHVAVVFTRYAMLAVEHRENIDDRTFGDLFYLANEELSDLPYYEALCRVMSEFANFIQLHCLLDETVVQDMLGIFMEQLPSIWTEGLRECA